MSASLIDEQTIPFASFNLDGRNKILNRARASPPKSRPREPQVRGQRGQHGERPNHRRRPQHKQPDVDDHHRHEPYDVDGRQHQAYQNRGGHHCDGQDSHDGPQAGDGLVDEVDPTEVEWEGESAREDDNTTDPTWVMLPALFGVIFVVFPVTDAVNATASRFLRSLVW